MSVEELSAYLDVPILVALGQRHHPRLPATCRAHQRHHHLAPFVRWLHLGHPHRTHARTRVPIRVAFLCRDRRVRWTGVGQPPGHALLLELPEVHLGRDIRNATSNAGCRACRPSDIAWRSSSRRPFCWTLQIAAMAADSEFTAVVRRLGCLRGVSTLTGFALAVEIGDWDSSLATPSDRSSVWCPRSSPLAGHGSRARSPRPVTLTSGGCLSNRPGTIKLVMRRARLARQPGCAVTRETGASTPAGSGSPSAANAMSWPTSPSPANWPAGAGPWPS